MSKSRKRKVVTQNSLVCRYMQTHSRTMKRSSPISVLSTSTPRRRMPRETLDSLTFSCLEKLWTHALSVACFIICLVLFGSLLRLYIFYLCLRLFMIGVLYFFLKGVLLRCDKLVVNVCFDNNYYVKCFDGFYDCFNC